MTEPKRPGVGAPEVPRVPPPEPELPGRTGAPPGREMPGDPAPRAGAARRDAAPGGAVESEPARRVARPPL